MPTAAGGTQAADAGLARASCSRGPRDSVAEVERDRGMRPNSPAARCHLRRAQSRPTERRCPWTSQYDQDGQLGSGESHFSAIVGCNTETACSGRGQVASSGPPTEEEQGEDSAVRPECFLCDPDGSLVYAQSPSFFAMLGWGAVVEGYSLIATKHHIPSMFDISAELVPELNDFTAAIRTQLGRLYGPSVITEHGRISLCEIVSSHEPHCFHAHRLVFPVEVDLMGALVAAKLQPRTHQNFNAARVASTQLNEYLYYERSDGVCVVADAHGCLQRQFFRGAIATSLGRAELKSWRRYPRLDIVERAKRTLSALTGP